MSAVQVREYPPLSIEVGHSTVNKYSKGKPTVTSESGGFRVPFLRLSNINGLIYPGVLELGYISDLESLAERIESSNLSTRTTGPDA